MNIQQLNSSNRIIFWMIIVTAIVIVILLLTVSTIYQTRNEQAQATRIAIPTATAEALEAIYQKGLAYINIERWPEAKRELEAVFEVNPNYKEVQAKLIEVQTKLSESDLEADNQGNTFPVLAPTEEGNISLDRGFVAYYPFNGNANDESGNGHHGIIHGPSLTVDRFGNQDQAFYFDGQGNFIEIPNATVLNPAQLSISVWVMIDPASSSDHLDIISKDGETYQRQYLLTRSSNGHFRAHIGQANASFYWYEGSVSPAAQQWYHLVLTWDGEVLKLYVNGKRDTSTYSSIEMTGAVVSPQPVRVGGGAPAGQLPCWFKGVIDDLRIYDRVLTEAEIKMFYER